jgi:hypothetical protein
LRQSELFGLKWGGFIPDPHFLCSVDREFSEPVSGILSKDSRYAIVDVNPFFNDNSSEILLLIQSHNEIFEHSLKFPAHKRVQAVLAEPEQPPAMVFPYNGGLVVLANFFGPAQGVYVLPLPLRKNSTLDLIRVGTPEFEEIANHFRLQGQELTTKDNFCKTTNDYAVATF